MQALSLLFKGVKEFLQGHQPDDFYYDLKQEQVESKFQSLQSNTHWNKSNEFKTGSIGFPWKVKRYCLRVGLDIHIIHCYQPTVPSISGVEGVAAQRVSRCTSDLGCRGSCTGILKIHMLKLDPADRRWQKKKTA